MRTFAAIAFCVMIAACASHGATTATAPCALSREDSVFAKPDSPVYPECAVETKAKRISTERDAQVEWTPQPNETSRKGGRCYSVDLAFVVDTRGIPEPGTARMVATNADEFGEAWLKAVPRLRYQPALLTGKPVRQLVKEHFSSTIARITVPAGNPLPSSPDEVRMRPLKC